MHVEARLFASNLQPRHVGFGKRLKGVSSHTHLECHSYGPGQLRSYTTPNARPVQSAHDSSTSTLTRRSGTILKDIKSFTTSFPVSIFRSSSNNPYHNLAIEHYLLKQSAPNSRILFTYTNRPCVVIGRNQNPWLECNIAKLHEGLPWQSVDGDAYHSTVEACTSGQTKKDNIHKVPLDLVRRRSGGGTVVHDAGNLNFSFIVPNDKDFTRNRHAQLVVDTLQQFKKIEQFKDHVLFDNIRVNERYDIVMTTSKGFPQRGDAIKEFKSSGSAFKLTRGRALHHGTLLLSSPNVAPDRSTKTASSSTFSTLLSSAARGYLDAKGVGSVRSPVHNLFEVERFSPVRRDLSTAFEAGLGSIFKQFYNSSDVPVSNLGNGDCEEAVNKDIYDDVVEMMSDEWRYCQTPTFDYASSHLDGNVKFKFGVRQGIIVDPQSKSTPANPDRDHGFVQLKGKKLHEVGDWSEYLPYESQSSADQVLAHFSNVFPLIHQSMLETQQVSEGTITLETSMESIDTAVARRRSHNRMEVEQGGQNTIVEK